MDRRRRPNPILTIPARGLTNRNANLLVTVPTPRTHTRTLRRTSIRANLLQRLDPQPRALLPPRR